MARVKVVNRQVIDGKEVKRDQVIEVSSGRARDLVEQGKAVEVVAPVAAGESVKKEAGKANG